MTPVWALGFAILSAASVTGSLPLHSKGEFFTFHDKSTFFHLKKKKKLKPKMTTFLMPEEPATAALGRHTYCLSSFLKTDLRKRNSEMNGGITGCPISSPWNRPNLEKVYWYKKQGKPSWGFRASNCISNSQSIKTYYNICTVSYHAYSQGRPNPHCLLQISVSKLPVCHSCHSKLAS